MNLNNKQVELLIKYLPKDSIDTILNFQKIIDYVCEKYKITEEQLSAKSKKGVLPHARMILIGLTISIFDPHVFEEYVTRDCPIELRKSKVKTGLGKIAAKAVNIHHSGIAYYLNRLRDYIYTNQIDYNLFKQMEIEIINKFEYID